MFSVEQKRVIAAAVQGILRATRHPELPNGEIYFTLHVQGAESWSWAHIANNGAVDNPKPNPWNESQAERNESFEKKSRDNDEALIRLGLLRRLPNGNTVLTPTVGEIEESALERDRR